MQGTRLQTGRLRLLSYTGLVTISNGAVTPATTIDRPAVQRGRLRDESPVAEKRVLLAAPRGYCAGVDRAVVAVEKALQNYGAPIYVRNQIVHNRHVVATLESRGAIFVSDLKQIPTGSRVIFSAHGVSPAVVKEAADQGLNAIDATCPLVTKVHREAIRFAKAAREILLVGHADHEEVEGTMGHAPDHTIVVTSPEHADTVEVRDPNNLVWLSQTTLSVDETMETVRRLRTRFPNLQDPPSDDICYATQNRQVAIKKIAPECDVVIVVGSLNSSNSMRLVDVARANGARAVHRIDYASEIEQSWLDGAMTVGVTSGASVPEELVREVLDQLSDAGFADVQDVVTAEEDLMFSLPKELRTDASGNPDDRGPGGRARRLDWQQ